jgi:hypothetical protein
MPLDVVIGQNGQRLVCGSGFSRDYLERITPQAAPTQTSAHFVKQRPGSSGQDAVKQDPSHAGFVSGE